MIKKHKKPIIIAVSVLTVAIILYRIFAAQAEKEGDTAKCEQGTFETTVSAVGEVEAVRSLDISIPEAMTDGDVRIYWLKILDLAAEGTVVKKGDYVASLDPGDVENELKRITDNLEQANNARESAKLDSTLKLSASRANIRNAIDGLTDKELKVEQSVYESKAYQRQAQIELEKAQRMVDQKKRNYKQEKRRHEVTLEWRNNDVAYHERRKKTMLDLKAGLKVTAPAGGMLMYANTWRGSKIKVGDEVGRWMPLIATLPDLTDLVSEAFVQEVDIKEVKEGQKVRISIDAFPGKKFTGTIKSVANIGQKMPDKEMNGFKVTIKIDPTTEKILPGMTTNNLIVTQTYERALMVPRPAVFGSDSVKFVYLRTALSTTKQQVETSGENETQFRISKGLQKGDKVLLAQPENASELELTKLK